MRLHRAQKTGPSSSALEISNRGMFPHLRGREEKGQKGEGGEKSQENCRRQGTAVGESAEGPSELLRTVYIMRAFQILATCCAKWLLPVTADFEKKFCHVATTYIHGSWRASDESRRGGMESSLGSPLEQINNHKRQGTEGEFIKVGNQEFWSDILTRK